MQVGRTAGRAAREGIGKRRRNADSVEPPFLCGVRPPGDNERRKSSERSPEFATFGIFFPNEFRSLTDNPCQGRP